MKILVKIIDFLNFFFSQIVFIYKIFKIAHVMLILSYTTILAKFSDN